MHIQCTFSWRLCQHWQKESWINLPTLSKKSKFYSFNFSQTTANKPHLLALSYSFDSKLFVDNATMISLLSLIIICSSELNECCFVVLSQILTGSSFWLKNIFSVFASSDRWTRFSRITQGLKSCICSDYYYSCGVLSLCTKPEHSSRLLPPASHCSVITAP